MPRQPTKRSQQVAKLIQRKLAVILQQYMRDERFRDVVITEVHLSNDTKFAKIYFTVLHKEQWEEITKALNKQAKSIRYTLAQAVTLRYVPELRFIEDRLQEEGNRLYELISKL